MIDDQSARQLALNPEQSFIVQAPAGSGKTELLTQRFLRLLACSHQYPQEIIALTFTRKAAGEMRERVLKALEYAQTAPCPTAPHHAQTWKLAATVLKHDQEKNWRLLDNPQRLRITTIDSLCAQLAQQLPISSGLGSDIKVTENCQPLYQQAVTALFEDLNNEVAWQKDLKRLLRHLDNRFELLERLLIELLARREQWLPVITQCRENQQLQQQLEQSIQAIHQQAIGELEGMLPHVIHQQIQTLSDFALNITLNDCSNTVEKINYWQQVTQWLFTDKNHLRKNVTEQQGFPPPSKAKNPAEKAQLQTKKQGMLALLKTLSSHQALTSHLLLIKKLPPQQIEPKQWQLTQSLLSLLPILCAHLQLVFAQHNTVDFNHIALAALQALGSEDAPSDLALRLDYQMHHILVDEFQDTSQLQFQLLQSLTRGWQANDGRTLFLVGDPMQSIYRFRQADVSLFLQAREQGLGDIKLTSLQLQNNFRSDQHIIDWINHHAAAFFPSYDDSLQGAVRYAVSQANREYAHSGAEINFSTQQASEIVKKIEHLQKNYPGDDIAILVRSRRHLTQILPMLQQADISFEAVDIEALTDDLLIRDLTSLCYALDHLGDRLAWLSLLRSPWCGLSLKDLHNITCLTNEQTTIWQALPLATLTEDGQTIRQRILPILEQAITYRARLPLRTHIEATWRALGGHDALQDHHDYENAQQFFDLLETLENAGKPPTKEELKQKLQQLFRCSKPNPKLQVMTIHKAKGLEFDSVILPELQRATRADGSPLLRWQLQSIEQQPHLMMASIHATGEDADPTYQYLQYLEQQKSYYERQRLLYVAITRAKKRLYLYASCIHQEQQIKAPAKSSLFSLLWPSIAPPNPSTQLIQKVEDTQTQTPATRLPVNRQSTIPVDKIVTSSVGNPQSMLDTITERAIGTITHHYLQQLSLIDLQHWNLDKTQQQKQHILFKLRQLGVPKDAIEQAAQTIIKALNQTLGDTIGHWILSARHAAHSEWRLGCKQNHQLKEYIIDRSFIDDGIRWVIDYKITQNTKQQPTEQLAIKLKEQYKGQLDNYCYLVKQLEPQRQVKALLYLPLQAVSIEI